MALSHRFLKAVRSIHLYLGVFTAPALIFFAITGGLQTFSFHETTRGSDYKPPAWLASAAQLHKKQTLVMPARRPRPEGVAAGADGARTSPPPAPVTVDAPAAEHASPASDRPADNGQAKPKKNLLPMKLFFAFIALSLLLSVLTGLYMAWRFSRRPALFSAVFVAGIAMPLLLMFF
ncbi:PepSY domain-containing protein [Rhodanobacter sp. L36]|uniref:PepSY domain-containing protein n=1 Tax=Rhodanobacter sp. L36 TaxID=1747221 RepID=UPI00131C49D0|nr:PepSY domain-containing protein [Rhodanobacter sp. L36]